MRIVKIYNVGGNKMLTINYRKNDQHQYNLAQGISVYRKKLNKLKKVRSYTYLYKKMFFIAFVFGIVTLLIFIRYALYNDTNLQAVFYFYLIITLFCLLGAMSMNYQYRKGLKQFLEDNTYSSSIILDDLGIKDTNERGREIKLLWEDYEACVMTNDVIVFLFNRQILIFIPYELDYADLIITFFKERALEHTIYSMI